MENVSGQDEHYGRTALGFFAGLLIGGLAGAVTTLLVAPQSGRRTRAEIQRRTVALRDQATASLEDTVEQARASGRRLSVNAQKQARRIQHQAEKLQQRGQDLLDQQKERWSPVVEAGQVAVTGTN
jgi:gas vesicle protein